ncbi:hypothetical protein FUAX_51120 (plasmid) [Fulvitalea axinellae]|uniref:Alpha-1,2-mannosidase n=1 Tax=Fulvitalea axinellae TaxID=1182444 RepID=A0AAU9CU50_9BACT|nr:hypothetical protein FUAX_51120 [Fulvitalea axinellae]
MLNRIIPALLLAGLLQACSCGKTDKAESATTAGPIEFVDPMIGTGGHGHTHPSATAPFGMVQVGPSQFTQGWDWCSGYHHSDSLIVGFTHKHLSGTGIGDLGDILIMPFTGETKISKGSPKDPDSGYCSYFKHDTEDVKAGYYAVTLDDYDVRAEMTATKRVGFHRYTFPKGKASKVMLDMGFGQGWDGPTDTKITMVDGTTVTGYRKSTGWANDQAVFFAAKFSKPFASAKLYQEGKETEGKSSSGKYTQAVIDYGKGAGEVLVKIGVSAVSEANALENLNAEIADWDFGKTLAQAQADWNKELSKIEATSTDTATLRTFYTALYHSMLAPALHNDVNGEYRGSDKKTHKAAFDNYTIFSLWDTYRGAHPLFTITQPERVTDFINSMLAQYKETGLLPVWSLESNETNTMVGYHAVPVIVDAYFKGFKFDHELAFEAIKASARNDRKDLNLLHKYGYIPANEVGESVAKLLEYCIDDWAIAKMAEKMGKTEDFEYYSKRAQNYRNVFDKQTGFFRGRMADGSWRTPFDPRRSAHRRDDFCEGNAWQYLWLVPHDVNGLVGLLGGEEKFNAKLDKHFNQSSEITGEGTSVDISGLIGQYAHGNEPSHHTAYLSNFTGEAWKSQERIRRIMDQFYTDKIDGLCGNEDCGQMSSWYILSSMGIYPVDPVSGVYVFGSPKLDRAEINLPGGKSFEIIAKGNAKDAPYIKSVKLNGKDYKNTYITHDILTAGGTLEFTMSKTPNKAFGQKIENRPPQANAKVLQ